MQFINIKDGNGIDIKIPAKLIQDVLVPMQLTQLADGPQLDAFGRLKVSNPTTLFDNKLRYGKSETFWAEKITGAATSVHDPNTSCVDMGVTSGTDSVVRQTRQRYKYQSGKGQLVDLTGILNPEVGTEKQIGYFQCAITGTNEPEDGICFETIEDEMGLSIYNVGVKERFVQEDWNIDSLDGTGPSGILVDWSKTQIFTIDFQWLGVGRVRFGLNINGISIPIHEINHANLLTDVYMRSGSQPLCYRIKSTGGAGTIKQICSTVQSQGGSEPTGIVGVIDRDVTPLADVRNDLVALLGIRLKTAQRDAIIEVVSTSIASLDKSDLRWVLAWNPVSVAGSKTWVAQTGSALEVMIGDLTNIVVPTINTDGGYESDKTRGATLEAQGNLNLGTDVDGVPDEMFLCVQNVKTGVESDMIGGLKVRQLV